jgi:CCR4-NOT transcriptional regulation complex NOT5 subunit
MAAIELKKNNWKFNKKFVTWFKKIDGDNDSLPTASNLNRQQSVSKYLL